MATLRNLDIFEGGQESSKMSNILRRWPIFRGTSELVRGDDEMATPSKPAQKTGRALRGAAGRCSGQGSTGAITNYRRSPYGQRRHTHARYVCAAETEDFNRWLIAGFGTTVKKPSQNRLEMGISGGLNAISGGLNGGSKTAKRLSTRAFLTPAGGRGDARRARGPFQKGGWDSRVNRLHLQGTTTRDNPPRS